MQVLFHVDESSRWETALGNVESMLEYSESFLMEFEIEVVTNGPAVRELTWAEANAQGLLERLKALVNAKVRFCVCRNAMKKQGLSIGALCPFVETVPSGVVEIMLKQREGFAYIKP